MGKGAGGGERKKYLFSAGVFVGSKRGGVIVSLEKPGVFKGVADRSGEREYAFSDVLEGKSGTM